MSHFGYTVIDIPIIENADLFLTKAGDQIIEKLFTFERSGRQYALRPEFTAAAAYRYLQRSKSTAVRWQFNGPVFEYRDHESGEGFQRLSAGAELIGAAGPHADAEVIALASHGVMKSKAGEWRLIIGHIGLMRQLLARFNLDLRTQRFLMSQRSTLHEYGKQAVLEKLAHYLAVGNDSLVYPDAGDAQAVENSILQMLDVMLNSAPHGKTMGGRTRADISRRLAYKQKQATQRSHIEAALDALVKWSALSGPVSDVMAELRTTFEGDEQALSILASWQKTINVLAAYEIPQDNILIQPDLARVWDYYTGIVFEVRIDDMPVAGGGRYDELMRIIGGDRDIPAVGFAFYIDNLLAKQTQNGASGRVNPILNLTAGSSESSAAAWATQLRSKGQTVVLDLLNNQQEIAGQHQANIIDGLLEFGGRRYTPAEIDQFIADLMEQITR